MGGSFISTAINGVKEYGFFSFSDMLSSDFGSRIGKDFIEECGGKDLSKIKENYSLYTKESHPEMSKREIKRENKALKKERKSVISKQLKENRKLAKENWKKTSLFDKSTKASREARKEFLSKHYNAAREATVEVGESKAKKAAENMASKTRGPLGRLWSKAMNGLYKFPIIGKVMKKCGPLAVVFAGVELVTLHMDAKKHNVRLTVKDYIKKGLGYAASMGGFAAGMGLAKALGSAGLVLGPWGGVIGFAAGLIIGGVAGWLTKKACDGTMGKTQLDNAKEYEQMMTRFNDENSRYYDSDPRDELTQYFNELTQVSSFA